MRISDWSSDVCSSDLLAMAWKGHQQLHRRPGDVQEKPDPVAHAAPPEFAPERHKMIVMHPDEVVGFDQRGKRFGETGIDPLIAPRETSSVFDQLASEMTQLLCS